MYKSRLIPYLIYLLIIFAISITFYSCGNSAKGTNETEDTQEMMNRIIAAGEDGDFEAQQILGDEMYTKIRDRHDCKAELWLSYHYFFMCCYNGGSEEEVKTKMELYTGRFLGRSGWDVVKTIDPIWFSNIQRCTELLIRAYEDNPSLTMKELEDYTHPEAFLPFTRLVLKNT